MPSLIRLLVVLGLIAAIAYGAMVALVIVVEPNQREMSVRSSARSPAAVSEAESSKGKSTRDAALLEAFLEMLAAERGASANTLAAYRRDLEDFRAKSGRLVAAVRRPRSAATSAALSGRGLRRKLAGAAAFGAPAILPLPRADGLRADDPTATARAAEAAPAAAEDSVRCRCRSPARSGAHRRDATRS